MKTHGKLHPEEKAEEQTLGTAWSVEVLGSAGQVLAALVPVAAAGQGVRCWAPLWGRALVLGAASSGVPGGW